MVAIIQLDITRHRPEIKALFWEYLTWANDQNAEQFGFRLDIAVMLDEDRAHLEKFTPPQGQLLVAQAENWFAGCIGLKSLSAVGVGEIKRLYVRPAYRRQGIGSALIAAMIEYAGQSGYHTLRLDSARYMTAAHALYHAAGFQDIAPYVESEIPAEFRRWWVFMERSLTDR